MTQSFDKTGATNGPERDHAPESSRRIKSEGAEGAVSNVAVLPTARAFAAVDPRPGNVFARAFHNFAIQDWFIGGYLLALLFALAVGNGPDREACARTVLIDFGCYFAAVVVTRGGVLKEGSFANAFVYRLSMFLPVFLSYFQLKHIAPAVTTRAVDAQLVALDLKLFGVEPSLAWDKYVTPHTTEWFAFFYFGYFFLLCAHVLPMMLNASNRARLAHFSYGIFFIFCTGHLVYLMVPGWGPYVHLASRFQHPLEGGLFWHLVKATVDAGGSLKDIFPSLHTATPTYFAIFSFMHRRTFPFRYTWPILAFASTQIIIATMFLRWHYLIDIFAGLALATTAALVSYRVVIWEMAFRARSGRTPIYTLLPWPRAAELPAGVASEESAIHAESDGETESGHPSVMPDLDAETPRDPGGRAR